jgi:hypothetical protein
MLNLSWDATNDATSENCKTKSMIVLQGALGFPCEKIV